MIVLARIGPTTKRFEDQRQPKHSTIPSARPPFGLPKYKRKSNLYKSDRDNETAQRKIEADERVAQLQTSIKRLEGENALSVMKEQMAAQKLIAAEANVETVKGDALLRLETAKNEGALSLENVKSSKDREVENIKSRTTRFTAVLTLVGIVIGGAIGRATATKTDSTASEGLGRQVADAAPGDWALDVHPPSSQHSFIADPGTSLYGRKTGAQEWALTNCVSATKFVEGSSMSTGSSVDDQNEIPVLEWQCIDDQTRLQGKSIGWYNATDSRAFERKYVDGQLDGREDIYSKSGALRITILYT